MASESGGDARGIGARLRAAREGRGLTVLQAAEKLRVDAKVLEALEADDFALLGAEVYVRGHLRRYAEFVGEAPTELQDLYGGGRRGAQPDLTRIPRGTSTESTRLVLPALVGLGAFTLAALLWWLLSTPGEKPQPLAAAPPSPPAAATMLAAPSAGERAAPPAAPPTGQAQLSLRFAALSWVEVSDSSGQRLLHGLYARDAVRSLSGTPPLRVVLGNAPAVELSINGQPVTLAGLARRDGSARVLIDAEGHASVAPPRLAHGD